MAKLVKETPILSGKDAKRFREQMALAANRKVSKEERDRILKSYNHFKSIADFPL